MKIAQQLLDKVAIAAFGGDAPGRGVQLGHVAQLAQRGEVVAHRGRAEIEAEMLHQRPRTNRLARLDKGADDHRQNALLTFG